MATVPDLCRRIFREGSVDVTEDAGRTWRATIDTLAVLYRGTPEPVLEGVDAFEVARELVRRVDTARGTVRMG